jgi:hypothetical protein
MIQRLSRYNPLVVDWGAPAEIFWTAPTQIVCVDSLGLLTQTPD